MGDKVYTLSTNSTGKVSTDVFENIIIQNNIFPVEDPIEVPMYGNVYAQIVDGEEIAVVKK